MQQEHEALVRWLASSSTVWERLEKDTLALQLKCQDNEKELSLREELLLKKHELEEVPEKLTHDALTRHVDALAATLDVGRPLRRNSQRTVRSAERGRGHAHAHQGARQSRTRMSRRSLGQTRTDVLERGGRRSSGASAKPRCAGKVQVSVG